MNNEGGELQMARSETKVATAHDQLVDIRDVKIDRSLPSFVKSLSLCQSG